MNWGLGRIGCWFFDLGRKNAVVVIAQKKPEIPHPPQVKGSAHSFPWQVFPLFILTYSTSSFLFRFLKHMYNYSTRLLFTYSNSLQIFLHCNLRFYRDNPIRIQKNITYLGKKLIFVELFFFSLWIVFLLPSLKNEQQISLLRFFTTISTIVLFASYWLVLAFQTHQKRK